MDKKYEEALLYDFYGELLTKRQKSLYEDVRMNDYSLGEIAELYGISRQSVHDTVRRTARILRGYEDKLGLVRKFLEIKRLAEEIRERSGDAEVRKLADEILEEL